MHRKPFSFIDISRECIVETGCYNLDGKMLGMKIHVPPTLFHQHPYNSTAYAFLQQLRQEIFEQGTVEFPGLPVNKTNYTLAQLAPKEHGNHPNPYMTDICQSPHQDTPPHPTAFWLGETRQYFATWVMSLQGLHEFMEFTRNNVNLGIEQRHKILVPQSLQNHTGLLLNHSPGLLLIDNSNHQKLYHARTCNFAAVAANPHYTSDAPMYAFNEIGLLEYMDSLDIYRGDNDRDAQDLADVKAFMASEPYI